MKHLTAGQASSSTAAASVDCDLTHNPALRLASMLIPFPLRHHHTDESLPSLASTGGASSCASKRALAPLSTGGCSVDVSTGEEFYLTREGHWVVTTRTQTTEGHHVTTTVSSPQNSPGE